MWEGGKKLRRCALMRMLVVLAFVKLRHAEDLEVDPAGEIYNAERDHLGWVPLEQGRADLLAGETVPSSSIRSVTSSSRFLLAHIPPYHLGFGDKIQMLYNFFHLAEATKRTLVLSPLFFSRPDMTKMADVEPKHTHTTTDKDPYWLQKAARKRDIQQNGKSYYRCRYVPLEQFFDLQHIHSLFPSISFAEWHKVT